ncbi:MAG: hypothetical protein AB1611_08680 [bacterium]
MFVEDYEYLHTIISTSDYPLKQMVEERKKLIGSLTLVSIIPLKGIKSCHSRVNGNPEIAAISRFPLTRE